MLQGKRGRCEGEDKAVISCAGRSEEERKKVQQSLMVIHTGNCWRHTHMTK